MTLTQLRGGVLTNDPRLDRIYPGVPEHLSSLNYLARDIKVRGAVLGEKPFRSYTWSVNQWLDQGQEGRCVEFGLCHEMLARPVVCPRGDIDQILAERSIYWPAQQEDQWEGGSYPGASPVYEGTSVLAGARVAARLGYYDEYRWGLDVEDMARMVGYKGPAVIGVNWYTGMFDTDAQGWLHTTGTVEGGHCLLAFAVKVVWKEGRVSNLPGAVDYDLSYFRLWNSWGPDWGVRGTAKISWTDMKRLIREEGEVMLPVRRAA
jgi:hypothetical protein